MSQTLHRLGRDIIGFGQSRSFGGGGYYSEIIAGIVGPSGRVLLVNNPPYDGYAKKGLATRLAGGRLPTVKYEVMPPEAMQLGAGTLDGALIVMSYHDLYVNDPADNGRPSTPASSSTRSSPA